MNNLKPHIRRSFRMEMIGTGCYEKLAQQYTGSNPDLGRRLRLFADHERAHGALFDRCHEKLYGKKIGGGTFWLFMGKLTALSQSLFPLKTKLRLLSSVEHAAVRQIEGMLADEARTEFHGIIRSILPDEKAHAGLYAEMFPA